VPAELIERTYEGFGGTPRASSTSTTRRRTSASGGVPLTTRLASTQLGGSPRPASAASWRTRCRAQGSLRILAESFTGTELDYAIEICSGVMDVIEPDATGARNHSSTAGHGRNVHPQHFTATHRVVPPHVPTATG